MPPTAYPFFLSVFMCVRSYCRVSRGSTKQTVDTRAKYAQSPAFFFFCDSVTLSSLLFFRRWKRQQQITTKQGKKKKHSFSFYFRA